MKEKKRKEKKRRGNRMKKNQVLLGDVCVSLWIPNLAFSHCQNKTMLGCQ